MVTAHVGCRPARSMVCSISEAFASAPARALETAGIDRDRAAQVIGQERGFTFRDYNPAGVDMAALWEVVEAVKYDGLGLTHPRIGSRFTPFHKGGMNGAANFLSPAAFG